MYINNVTLNIVFNKRVFEIIIYRSPSLTLRYPGKSIMASHEGKNEGEIFFSKDKVKIWRIKLKSKYILKIFTFIHLKEKSSP